MLKVNEKAPNFQLYNSEGNLVKLSDFAGKRLVLYFYPKDDTPGCTKEGCNFRDRYQDYKKNNIEIIGISYDDPESHKKFKEKYNLPFILLSDTKKEVAKSYGAYDSIINELFPKRITFLIDERANVIEILNNVDVNIHADEILKKFGA